MHKNKYASTSSIQAGFRAKLEISTDSYIATRARLVSMLRVWDAAIARKKYYDRTGYLNDDRNYMESFLVAMQVIPDRARIGYLGPFSWEAIQAPPAYDEYADSGSEYTDEPLTPAGGDLEVVSVVSSDKDSPGYIEANEDSYFPAGRDEELDGDEELQRLIGDEDLDYLMGGVGRDSGMGGTGQDSGMGWIGRDSGMGAAKKRGYDEIDSDQDIRPRKRQC